MAATASHPIAGIDFGTSNSVVATQGADGSLRFAEHKLLGSLTPSFRSLLLQKLDDSSPVSKAQVFFHLAKVNLLEGDKKKAIQMLERSLANDKELAEAKAMLEELKD